MLRLGFVLLGVSTLLASPMPGKADVMPLPVPLRTIYPKDQLKPEDFVFKDFEVNDVIRRTYVTTVAQISQHVAGRVLRPGKPVPLRALARRADVRKGEQAVARFASDGIEIQGILVPEQDGVIGDVLRARNPETGVSILVRVAEDGTLTVGAGQ